MTNQFDINTASPAVLLSIGFGPDEVAAILAKRTAGPIRTPTEILRFASADPRYGNVTIGGGIIWWMRATARPRLANGQRSDPKRSAGAMIKVLALEHNPPYEIMRWYSDYPAMESIVPQLAAGGAVQVLGQ